LRAQVSGLILYLTAIEARDCGEIETIICLILSSWLPCFKKIRQKK